MNTIVTSESKEVIIGPEHPVVMIGERINPTGRRKLANSLEAGDMSVVQNDAKAQVEAGALILDVNVGVSGADEKALMIEALAAVREVTDAPLCIDSASPGGSGRGPGSLQGQGPGQFGQRRGGQAEGSAASGGPIQDRGGGAHHG
jgi:5-methyltetrahydrofolate--homocysteine methyltransferase